MSYRSLNFRDNVLWAIAYKTGVNPLTNLLNDQATAFASYVNAWVRRTWDATDWEEWTTIQPYTPDVNHIVDWEQDPSDPVEGVVSPRLGKILKVYLVDPTTTWLPVDTPFHLRDNGVYVGFEHGATVWIKFVLRAPMFTADAWDASVTYKKDALTYSPVTGECYKSKTGNNIGNDPSGSEDAFTVEELQPWTPGDPGHPGQPKIIGIVPQTFPPIPNPPPAGMVFNIEVHDATDTFIGDATHTADGSELLVAIFADLAVQLAAEPLMSTFTVTSGTLAAAVFLNDESDFIVPVATYTFSGITLPLFVVQQQMYIPPVPSVPGDPQIIKATMSQSQVIRGAVYSLTFTSTDNIQHEVSYTALSTDGAVQILNGLVAAMIAAQPDDSFFQGVQSSIDTVGLSITFTIDNTLGEVGLISLVDSDMSNFWDIVLFPYALVDQTVQGSYADYLRESGQTDKAQTELQIVPTEQQVRTGAQVAQEYDEITDQAKQKSRYAVK